MGKLIAIILDYESDTFNAKARKVTRKEAKLLAQTLLVDFYTMVEEGGRMHCDGLLLDFRLDAIREAEEYIPSNDAEDRYNRGGW